MNTAVAPTVDPVVVRQAASAVVVVERTRAVVIAPQSGRGSVVVSRGGTGRAGPQGPAGDATLVQVGAQPISGHSAVAVDALGQLIAADCTNPAHLGAVLGVVVNAYSAGASAEVKTGFPLEHLGWTWTAGPVFVGAAGQITQSLPPGAVFSQTLGHAVSATRVLIDLQPPITIA